MTNYYVGLMSGTSMDGIDAVLVSFSDTAVELLSSHTEHYPQRLKDELLAAIARPQHEEIDTTGALDQKVGECFRDGAFAVIDQSGVRMSDIRAIGSHGQTVRHRPDAEPPFSLQLGDAGIIAAATGIKTVANFRQADIDVGGQGAPLVPPFHQWLFAAGGRDRVIVNIGGIANITILPCGDTPVSGFDTGPGNGLMDAWIRDQLGKPFDHDGRWAAAGQVIDALFSWALADPYFALLPPKSTGFEYFNLEWLRRADIDRADPADVQATLCELSAQTIAGSIKRFAADATEVFVCGGGAHNRELMRRLQRNLPDAVIANTAVAGLDPDWVEAVAFAWLAMRTVNGKTGNLPSVTGASHKVVLGDIHFT